MINEIPICEYLRRRSVDGTDILVDIREKLMYEFGTIPGAVNIPLDEIRQLYRLPKDRDIYVFCQAGEVSGEIVELLADAGYTVYNLTGGYRAYLRECLAEPHPCGEKKGAV